MRLSTLSLPELRARPGTKWHLYPDDVLAAWIAEMDLEAPEPIQAVVRQRVEQAAYGYAEATLYPALAEAFFAHMQRCFGWQPSRPHVVPVADLVQAMFTTVAAFTARGQGVVLQTPIYPPFQNAVRETGRRIVEHRLVDDGTRFVSDGASLEQVVDRDTPLLMLCNPHNPTGRVFERSELEAIANVALERDLVVVADEVHAELVYPGHQHIPFASLGPEVAARTITITSATKAYNIPGLRCGVLHFGSDALRERFREVFPDRMLGVVSRFGIEATVAAWRDCGPWLAQVMQLLGSNRDRLHRFLERELPAVRCYVPEATYLAWFDCRSLGLPQVPQQFFLDHARVALNDGAEFGPPGVGHVRLNFGTAPSILDEVLERMRAALG